MGLPEFEGASRDDNAATGTSAANRIEAEQLRQFIANALNAVGLPRKDASAVARLMMVADMRGADGHGVFRLPQYVRRIRAGGINVRPRIRVVRELEATALVDGDNGMGHLVVEFAARRAIEMAARSGVGWVGVRRGNHAGPGALYAMMPLIRDMVGIYCAIGNANHMAPWGGRDRLLSTNPIAVAVPTARRPPLVFDMATSVVSYGTVKQRAKRAEPLPEGWMINSTGEPLLDPGRSDEGLLLPTGGYKGYGLSLIVTVLAGILNGAAVGHSVVDFNHDDRTATNTGQVIAAIDVQQVCDAHRFKEQVDAFISELKASKTLPGVKEIRVPGERSHSIFLERSRKGIPLNRILQRDLDELARHLGIEPIAR